MSVYNIRAIRAVTLGFLIGFGTLPVKAQLISPVDYWRVQQARAASDYYRYARSSSAGGYDQYGHFGAAFQRIDSALSSNRQHFSPYELNDLADKIAVLKQRIASRTSQGFSSLEYQDDVGNLEAEVARKVDDSVAHINNVEHQIGDALSRVEQLFFNNKSKLTDSDCSELETRINRLKEKCSRQNLLSMGSSISGFSADFTDESRKIESAIIGKTLFVKSAPVKEESRTGALNDSSVTRPTNAAPEQPPHPLRSGSLSAYRLAPTPVPAIAPPLPSLAKAFESTENRLLDLHEAERLGSFDIDVLSERILKLKYNLKKMVAKTGTLSPRQEESLRNELEKINREITDRTHATAH